MTSPAVPTVDSEIAAWCDFVAAVEHRNQAARQIGDYFRKLTTLTDAPKLEDIWQSIAQQHDKLAKDSLKLWEYWLRLAPARLSAHDRHLLGEFAAVLRPPSSGSARRWRRAAPDGRSPLRGFRGSPISFYLSWRSRGIPWEPHSH